MTWRAKAGSWRRRSRAWTRVSTAERRAEGEQFGFVRRERARVRDLRLSGGRRMRVWRFFRRRFSINYLNWRRSEAGGGRKRRPGDGTARGYRILVVIHVCLSGCGPRIFANMKTQVGLGFKHWAPVGKYKLQNKEY